MKRFIEDYSREKFDLEVIGGGITGAALKEMPYLTRRGAGCNEE